MDSINEYQDKIVKFMNPDVMQKKQDILMNAVLGLAGEAGEVSDLVKKWLYHGHELDIEKLKLEIGDCQFYVALAATALDMTASQINQLNIEKLSRRYPTGLFSVGDSLEKKDQHG